VPAAAKAVARTGPAGPAREPGAVQLPDRAAVGKGRAAKERPSAAAAADDEEPLTAGRADVPGPDRPLSHQPSATVHEIDSPELYEPRPGDRPPSP
jgi:hypothetical protein